MGSKQTTVSDKSTTGTNVGQYTDPLAQKFQQSLFPQIQKAIGLAQEPVYGEANKASYLQGLDQLANASMTNLRANLARSGAMDSGRMSQGLTDINMDRNRQASQFFSQIPFLNRQATMQALPGLFGAGSQLLGVGPRSQTSSGTEHGSQTTSSPWWSGLAQGAMGAAMNAFVPGLGSIMGGKVGGGGMGGGGLPSSAWSMPGMNMDTGMGMLAPPPIGPSPYR